MQLCAKPWERSLLSPTFEVLLPFQKNNLYHGSGHSGRWRHPLAPYETSKGTLAHSPRHNSNITTSATPRPVSGSDWLSHRLYPLQGIIMGKAIQMSGKTGTFSNPVAWGGGGLHQWPPMGPLTSYRFMLQFPYLSTGSSPVAQR